MQDNVEIQNFRHEHLPALVALINDADAHDRLERATTLEEMEEEMAELNYYPETDCFLAWHEGRLVGYADMFFRKSEEESTVYTWGVVRPEWRRRGLGSRLMAALEKRAVERLSEVEHGPVYLNGGALDREADRRALFESLGMQLVRYYINMARPLNGNLPAVEVPAGYRLRSFDGKRDEEPVWRVVNTAFRDHWGWGQVGLDEFVHDIYQSPRFQPELLVVAEDEVTGEMVGCSLNRIDPDWIAQTGRKEGYVNIVAVLRQARRHGLGTALLAESMRLMRAEGMEGVHLNADAENLTGAVRIYERQGFAVRKNFVAFRKSLRAG